MIAFGVVQTTPTGQPRWILLPTDDAKVAERHAAEVGTLLPTNRANVSARRRRGGPPLGSFSAQGWGRNSRAHHGRAARSALRSGRRPVSRGGPPPRRRANHKAS